MLWNETEQALSYVLSAMFCFYNFTRFYLTCSLLWKKIVSENLLWPTCDKRKYRNFLERILFAWLVKINNSQAEKTSLDFILRRKFGRYTVLSKWKTLIILVEILLKVQLETFTLPELLTAWATQTHLVQMWLSFCLFNRSQCNPKPVLKDRFLVLHLFIPRSILLYNFTFVDIEIMIHVVGDIRFTFSSVILVRNRIDLLELNYVYMFL